jgi:small subunit ribosomal protein S17e
MMRYFLLLKQTQIHILVYRYKKPLLPIEDVNRVRRISTELLTIYKEKFGTDFRQNKKALDEIAIVRSKGLKNEIAGFITTHLRRELEEQKEKESQVIKTQPVDRSAEMEEQILS